MDGQNLCSHYIQKCYGSLRCCNDCHFQWITNLNISSLIDIISDKATVNFTTSISVTFIDRYHHIIKVNSIISILIITIYIFAFLLRTAYKDSTSKKSPKDKIDSKSNTTNFYYFRIIHGLVATLFVLILFTSICITTYDVLYFLTHIHQLLKCQPSFVIILTWIVLLIIHILNQIIHVSHVIITKSSNVYTNLCGLKSLIQFITSFVNLLLILWWICIGVYFFGVYTNKWLIKIPH